MPRLQEKGPVVPGYPCPITAQAIFSMLVDGSGRSYGLTPWLVSAEPFLISVIWLALRSLPCANNVGAGTLIRCRRGISDQLLPGESLWARDWLTVTRAKGYSNYNALQVDFRQRAWHGLQFDANYTWSHTLGVATQNNWQGQGAVFSLRDMRLSYGPTLYDLRHVVHINGTYDLPFGKGKRFANSSNALDRVVGGWTVGTIFTFQTGAPFLLLGGTSTFQRLW